MGRVEGGSNGEGEPVANADRARFSRALVLPANDDAEVRTEFGCIVSDQRVRDVLALLANGSLPNKFLVERPAIPLPW